MKKLLIVLSIAVLIFSMTGCSGDSSTTPTTGSVTVTNSTVNAIEIHMDGVNVLELDRQGAVGTIADITPGTYTFQAFVSGTPDLVSTTIITVVAGGEYSWTVTW